MKSNRLYRFAGKGSDPCETQRREGVKAFQQRWQELPLATGGPAEMAGIAMGWGKGGLWKVSAAAQEEVQAVVTITMLIRCR